MQKDICIPMIQEILFDLSPLLKGSMFSHQACEVIASVDYRRKPGDQYRNIKQH